MKVRTCDFKSRWYQYHPFAAPSLVLACPVSSWRAVAFSAGGDGVGGVFEHGERGKSPQ
jgi:hypothetical protein